MTPWLLAVVLAASPVQSLVQGYLDRYFHTFPTRATEAGRHDLDRELEDLPAPARARWLTDNRETRDALAGPLAGADLAPEDRLDGAVLRAQVEREIHDLAVLRRPERDPLYWTSLAANASVFLLVREDRPLAERLEAARARAALLPRLAAQAREALGGSPASEQAPETLRIAARQARASAAFYRDGFAKAAPGAAGAASLAVAGSAAATGLEELAAFLEKRAEAATGSPRLGSLYTATLRAGLGSEEAPDALLARAEAGLREKRAAAAGYGRRVWREVMGDARVPAGDEAVLSALFGRLAEDRDEELPAYFESWRRNVRELEALVRRRDVVTLPDPLTLSIERSPAFFVGQSVGGVYPAGPYSPDAPTLLFLPMPADDAGPSERTAFFHDFNRHFNGMIAAHETIPGHYLQLKWAARHASKLRAVFADPVYVEGWGTFCERLMLDEGWGGTLPRLAHSKKQLENLARTVVDVRVHTRGATREEVLRYVREEALQDEQFAANMWTRSLTSSPQLLTYALGYEQVMGLYEEVRRQRGAAFRLREFMDAMMELGPVPVRYYREKLLGAGRR